MPSTVPAAVPSNKGVVFKLATVDYDGDLKKIGLTPEDKDAADLTFLEAATGDLKDFKLAITALLATATGSLWLYLWNNPGIEVACVYGPHGNAVPAVGKPHYTFTVKATGKPPVEQEAKTTKERSYFDYEFEVTSAIVLVTA